MSRCAPPDGATPTSAAPAVPLCWLRSRDGTPVGTLLRAAELGLAEGLRYVYAGNLPGRVGPFENTYCPSCRTLLVERAGYSILRDRLTSTRGLCPACSTRIPGVWG